MATWPPGPPVTLQTLDSEVTLAELKERTADLCEPFRSANQWLPDGTKVIDSEGFPEEYKPEATAGGRYLETLRKEQDLDWTFLSPSAEFVEGERTGKFRLGKDHLLFGADGKSWITFADFAIALLDEVEHPAHSRQRFTVGY